MGEPELSSGITLRCKTQWYIKSVGGGAFNITNVKSQKSINVAGAEHHNGAWVHQWDNPGVPETQFRLHPVGDGAYTIQAAHSNKYLNVERAENHNGANIIQWDNPGMPETQWIISLV